MNSFLVRLAALLTAACKAVLDGGGWEVMGGWGGGGGGGGVGGCVPVVKELNSEDVPGFRLGSATLWQLVLLEGRTQL